MQADVTKSKSTSVMVSREGCNEVTYKASVFEEKPDTICIDIDGCYDGNKVSEYLELPLADMPYLVDLLKEFSITGQL